MTATKAHTIEINTPEGTIQEYDATGLTDKQRVIFRGLQLEGPVVHSHGESRFRTGRGPVTIAFGDPKETEGNRHVYVATIHPDGRMTTPAQSRTTH